jgi:hypothetical protein
MPGKVKHLVIHSRKDTTKHATHCSLWQSTLFISTLSLIAEMIKEAVLMNNILSFIQLFLPFIYWMDKQVGASICLQCGA